jgi:hypothetical protein
MEENQHCNFIFLVVILGPSGHGCVTLSMSYYYSYCESVLFLSQS